MVLALALLHNLACESGGEGSNRAPIAMGVPLQTAAEGSELVLQFVATDPDGDRLTYEGKLLPAGSRLDADLGTLRWTPGFDQAGNSPYYAFVWDDGSPPLSARLDFRIDVTDTNRPPEIKEIGRVDALAGTPLILSLGATDPDGDAIRYKAIALPPGAILGRETGRVAWVPAHFHAGEHAISVAAIDAGTPPGETVTSGTSVVAVGNLPPACVPVGVRSAREGEAVEIQYLAEDPEGDRLTYAAIEGTLPEGSSISPDGLFLWTPDHSDAGAHLIEAIVQDDGEPPGRVTCGVNLLVRDVNRPPLLVYPLFIDAAEGVPVSVLPELEDPDGHGVSLEANELPEGATFDLLTGEIAWSPSPGMGGSPPIIHRFRVSAVDNGTPPASAVAEGVFSVLRTNQAPEAEPVADQEVAVGQRLVVELEAADPDEDEIRYRLDVAPLGASVHLETGRFEWQPIEEDEGVHLIRIEAVDNGRPPLSAFVAFRVRVVPEDDGAGDDRCPEVCEALMDCGCEGIIDPAAPRCDHVCDQMNHACVINRVLEGELCDARPCFGVLDLCEGAEGAPIVCNLNIPGGPFGTEPGSDDEIEENADDLVGEVYAVGERGLEIDEWVGELAPEDGGGSPPRIEISPASGSFVQPFSFRLCIGDPDGLANLDVDSLSYSVNNTELAAHMYWHRTGETTLCSELGQECAWGAGREARYEILARIEDRDGNVTSAEATYEPLRLARTIFRDATADAGLSLDWFTGNSHTGGVAWIDYDADGYPDLFAVAGTGRENRLFHNEGDGTFRDATPDIMRLREEACTGAIFADIDNDGDDDLYVYSDHPELILADDHPNPVPGDPNHLFRNDGEDGWTDITARSGLGDERDPGEPYRTISAMFGDYDLDGCVDLFAVHWRMGTRPDRGWDADKLYRNDCEGGFEDVTDEAGLDDEGRKGFAGLMADLNMDGWPDIYVVNVYDRPSEFWEVQPDFIYGTEPSFDQLWINNGDGTFTEQARQAGVGEDAGAGMGIDLGDFDHDGDFELYITDLNEPIGYGNAFYRNLTADRDDGTIGFSDDSYRAGARPTSASFSWGVSVADFNNDGGDDIYVVGSRDRWIFMSNLEGDFVALSSPEPTLGIGDGYQDLSGAPRVGGKGTAVADYDQDGDVDLVIWRDHDTLLLLENVSPNENHWIRVRLDGTTSNGSGIGALVVIHGQDGWQHHKQVVAGQSQQSQAERTLHFGLGDRVALDRMEIHWPGGRLQVIDAPAVDRLHAIRQP